MSNDKRLYILYINVFSICNEFMICMTIKCGTNLFRWGQIFILDSLANYAPRDEKEAQRLVLCSNKL